MAKPDIGFYIFPGPANGKAGGADDPRRSRCSKPGSVSANLILGCTWPNADGSSHGDNGRRDGRHSGRSHGGDSGGDGGCMGKPVLCTVGAARAAGALRPGIDSGGDVTGGIAKCSQPLWRFT